MNERKGSTSSSNDESSAPQNETEALSPYYATAGEAVSRYSHCPICGSNLHFSHVTDFLRNLTQETARCPECGLKPRRIVHRLQ